MPSRFRTAVLMALFVYAGQQIVPIEPTILRVSTSQSLNVPVSSSLKTVCDGDGNLYYRLLPANNSYNDSIVMRLDVHTQTPTLYVQPAEFVGKAALTDFVVTPSGGVWFLDEMKEGGHTVLGFDSDVAVTSRAHLDTPVGLLLNSFRVATDGTILVGGFFTKYAAKELQGKGYLGLFDKSGKLRKELGKEVMNDVDFAAVSTNLLEGAAASGSDGNFYFLQGAEILVISEYGEVVRRIKIQRPDKESSASKVDLSDDLLSVEFLKSDKDGVLHAEFLVLQTATGQPFGLYKPSEDLGDDCICFSRRNGYLFSRLENGKVQLLSARLR